MKKNIKNFFAFTLVEVIVVLTIIALMAALLVPSLFGYIDDSKKKIAIEECQNVVTATQTLANDQYNEFGISGDKLKDTVTTDAILKLAHISAPAALDIPVSLSDGSFVMGAGAVDTPTIPTDLSDKGVKATDNGPLVYSELYHFDGGGKLSYMLYLASNNIWVEYKNRGYNAFTLDELDKTDPEDENSRYTITFKNFDGKVISKTEYKSGTVILAPIKEPVRAGYNFVGWSPTFTAGDIATSDMTYTAVFTNPNKKYTIKFVDADGKLIKAAQSVSMGSLISSVAPTEYNLPADTDKVKNTFTGWKQISKGEGEGDIIDLNSATVTKRAIYQVTYKSEDKGTPTIPDDIIIEGSLPNYVELAYQNGMNNVTNPTVWNGVYTYKGNYYLFITSIQINYNKSDNVYWVNSNGETIKFNTNEEVCDYISDQSLLTDTSDWRAPISIKLDFSQTVYNGIPMNSDGSVELVDDGAIAKQDGKYYVFVKKLYQQWWYGASWKEIV